MSTPALELQGISCTFVSRDDPGQRYTAVRDVTLTVGDGEFVSVVGPTGCGKSTLLNVAAGLLPDVQAGHPCAAGIRAQQAGEDAHGGGLAGAVLPQQAVDLSLGDGEADAVQR